MLLSAVFCGVISGCSYRFPDAYKGTAWRYSPEKCWSSLEGSDACRTGDGALVWAVWKF